MASVTPTTAPAAPWPLDELAALDMEELLAAQPDNATTAALRDARDDAYLLANYELRRYGAWDAFRDRPDFDSFDPAISAHDGRRAG